jgi:tellurite resistance protein TerC
MLNPLKQIKRIIVAVIGFTILLIGVILIVLPDPAFVVIPIGLAILATEFVWGRRLLKKVKSRIKKPKKDNTTCNPHAL